MKLTIKHATDGTDNYWYVFRGKREIAKVNSAYLALAYLTEELQNAVGGWSIK